MRDYFKPWQRKIGVVTLLVACVFAAGWVKSINDQDRLTINSPRSFFYFGSNSGRIYGQYRGYAQQNLSRNSMFAFDSWNASNDDLVSWVSESSMRRIDWCGLHFSVSGGVSWMITLFIPYWSLVFPLTLLSAWLLLPKKPPAKVKEQP